MKFHKAIWLSLALFFSIFASACDDIPNTPDLSEESAPSPVTLRYFTVGAPDADLKLVNNAINEILQKKINVRIEYNKINWSDYGRRLATIINSGTNFDIAFSTEGDQGDYSGYARKGVWLELDSYLNTIGKEMYSVINPILWEGVKLNNKIYGVPTNKEVAVPEWWLYKKELVEKYNIDISKYNTLESLEPIFKIIQQNEPDVAIMELEKYSNNFFVMDNYEYIINKDIPLMVKSTDRNLKIVNIFDTDLARKILNTLRKYYKAGYINEDAAVKAPSGLIKGHNFFWRQAGGGPYSTTSWSNGAGFEIVAHQISPSIVTTESARGGIMVVSSNTKNPEACIRFLNCLNTDSEVRNFINFGIEGLHYDLTAEGQVDIKEDSGYLGVQYTQGNWFILRTLKGDPANKWDVYKKFNSEAIRSEALSFTPDISSPQVSTQMSAVAKVTAKYYPALMTGTVDPGKELPIFLQELKAAGIDELKNTFQQQIDAWKASKK